MINQLQSVLPPYSPEFPVQSALNTITPKEESFKFIMNECIPLFASEIKMCECFPRYIAISTIQIFFPNSQEQRSESHNK